MVYGMVWYGRLHLTQPLRRMSKGVDPLRPLLRGNHAVPRTFWMSDGIRLFYIARCNLLNYIYCSEPGLCSS